MSEKPLIVTDPLVIFLTSIEEDVTLDKLERQISFLENTCPGMEVTFISSDFLTRVTKLADRLRALTAGSTP